MRAVTIRQWERMNARQRSWLVHRAQGGRALVFWHATQADGTTVGGSFRSLPELQGVISHAKRLTEQKARKLGLSWPIPWAATVPEPSVAFPLYAELEHVASSLLLALVKEAVVRITERDGFHVTVGDSGCVFGRTLAEALSLAFLQHKGVLCERLPGAR